PNDARIFTQDDIIEKLKKNEYKRCWDHRSQVPYLFNKKKTYGYHMKIVIRWKSKQDM
ncbi:unnamed protein product, partial [Didymodactylos carnosus]